MKQDIQALSWFAGRWLLQSLEWACGPLNASGGCFKVDPNGRNSRSMGICDESRSAKKCKTRVYHERG